MLTLHHLLSLPVWLSTTLIHHALAAPADKDVTGFIDDRHQSSNKLAASLTGFDSCTSDQKTKIIAGFTEMNSLFTASLPMNWTNSTTTPTPEQEFFGKLEKILNYTAIIEDNIERAVQYAALKGSNITAPDIRVRCDDPSHVCNSCTKKEGKSMAYNVGNTAEINFCDKYFEVDGLDQTMEKATSKKSDDQDNIMTYYNRGTIWARQVMHISSIGTATRWKFAGPNPSPNATSPWLTTLYTGPMTTSFLAGVKDQNPDTDFPNNIRTPKYAYGATRAKLLASLSTQDAYDAANNPENYALYAQARYVMSTKGFYPSGPVMNWESESSVLNDANKQEVEKPRYACCDVMDVVTPVSEKSAKKGGNDNNDNKSVSSDSSSAISERICVGGYLPLWAVLGSIALLELW